LTNAAAVSRFESLLLFIMDEILRNLASIGLGNLSPAQLASVLGPEKIALLEQMDGLRSLRAQVPPSAPSQGKEPEDEESFIQNRKQAIKHAKDVLEVSG
jgi:hypothetical protein